MILDDLGFDPEELELLTDEELAALLDALERDHADWTLNPRQQDAENLAGTVDVTFYGGAAGGGKTEWMLWHAYELSRKYRRHSTLALRRTLPQLKDSLIKRSLERFDPQVARYKVGEKEWVFKETGATIRFGFCDTEEDVRHYLSTEYDLIIFEELTEFTERQFTLVRSRNRATVTKRAQGIRPHTIAASNPGQVGHGWVKQMFVEPTEYGQKVATRTVEVMGRKRDLTVAFVPAKVTDNPKIDPDYLFNLASLPDIERRQYLDGDWDIFEGQFFTEFSRSRHVVPPFPIPESWPRLRAIDYGSAKPWCCLWLAFDWDGNAYVYRELYGPDLTARQQARAAIDVSVMVDGDGKQRPEGFLGTFADPSIWTRGGDGRSIAQMYREEGMICRKAMNARRDGWSRVRDFLRGDGTRQGGPKLIIFDICPNLIRTLPLMVHDKKNPEDLDTTLEDHAADALRYGLMARSPKATWKQERQRRPDEVPSMDDFLRDKARGPVHPVLGHV